MKALLAGIGAAILVGGCATGVYYDSDRFGAPYSYGYGPGYASGYAYDSTPYSYYYRYPGRRHYERVYRYDPPLTP